VLKIKQTVIVEGKHDKIKLENIISANIISTDGFKIYNNKEKQLMIKKLAEKSGIIIFTDSDSAGKKIRGFIKNIAGDAQIINIYAPKIIGKEKRKRAASKENIIGVEGTDDKIILELFEKVCSATLPSANTDCRDSQPEKTRKISKIDFYNDGLSGGTASAKKREYLCERLALPLLSANALVEALNIIISFEEYKKIISGFKE